MVTDVEGAEPLLLRGARHYVTKYKPTIILEADPKLLRRAGSSLDALLSELALLEYRAFEIVRFGVIPFVKKKHVWAGNWLCVPADRTDIVQSVGAGIRRVGLLPCVRGVNPLCIRKMRTATRIGN